MSGALQSDPTGRLKTVGGPRGRNDVEHASSPVVEQGDCGISRALGERDRAMRRDRGSTDVGTRRELVGTARGEVGRRAAVHGEVIAPGKPGQRLDQAGLYGRGRWCGHVVPDETDELGKPLVTAGSVGFLGDHRSIRSAARSHRARGRRSTARRQFQRVLRSSFGVRSKRPTPRAARREPRFGPMRNMTWL